MEKHKQGPAAGVVPVLHPENPLSSNRFVLYHSVFLVPIGLKIVQVCFLVETILLNMLIFIA